MGNRIKFSSVLMLAMAFLLIMPAVTGAFTEGLSKAPGWSSDFDLKVPGMKFVGPKSGKNPVAENAKVINSWGYGARDIEEIKDLLPEEFYNCLKHPEIWGNFRINEVAPFPMGGPLWKKYQEATEKNKGTVSLDERGGLVNYKVGCPFPDADYAKEPVKLMQNFEKKFWTDDRDVTGWVRNVDRAGNNRNALVDNIILFLDNRLVVDPKPVYTPNPAGLQYIHVLVFPYPYRVAGTIGLTYRYRDPEKDDNMWMYIPSMRRVRRMSTAQRQDRLPFGMAYIYDTNEGFQGKESKWDWKYLGKKEMLVPMKTQWSSQYDLDGYFTGVDLNYQRVNMHVIEGRPHQAVTLSKIKLYVDPETFFTPYGINYDIKGRAWFFQFYGWAVDKNWYMNEVNMFSVDLLRQYVTNCDCMNYITNEGKTIKDYSMETLKAKFLQR